MTVAWV